VPFVTTTVQYIYELHHTDMWKKEVKGGVAMGRGQEIKLYFMQATKQL